VITIHQRYRQTDRQTTCDRNTALCTKVHRAVKTDKSVPPNRRPNCSAAKSYAMFLATSITDELVANLIKFAAGALQNTNN